MLQIKKTIGDGKADFVLEGRLDTVTAPELEEALKDSLEGISALTLDLGKLSYISSAGLRILLTTQKTMNKQGEMTLIHVNETVREILDVTGFSEILSIR